MNAANDKKPSVKPVKSNKINLLKILKDLRKVDPDSLVLNFLETDDPDLDGQDLDDDSDN